MSRYDNPSGSLNMIKSDDGDYILYSDLVKVKSIISRLLHEIETDCNGPSYELLEEVKGCLNE